MPANAMRCHYACLLDEAAMDGPRGCLQPAAVFPHVSGDDCFLLVWGLMALFCTRWREQVKGLLNRLKAVTEALTARCYQATLRSM